MSPELIYDERGVRIPIRCKCPACRHPVTRVLRTGEMDDGTVIRQRECKACSHRWFTGQEPEYVIPSRLVRWTRDRPTLKTNDEPAH